jgi:proteasome lid subunit RPN8/RPN11
MIRLPKWIYSQIKNQAAKEAPNEACGYLLGIDGQDGRAVKLHHPMTNVDASPEHFSFDPKEQFAAMKRSRSLGLDLVGVYHSHPASPARMSLEDIRLANDTSMYYLIYSRPDNRIKGFTVTKQKAVREVPVDLL